MAEEKIWSPVKDYHTFLKPQFRQEAEKYFQNLVKEAKTNVALNRDTVKKYNKKHKEELKAGESLTRIRVVKTILIILAIAFYFAAVIGIVMCINNPVGPGFNAGALGVLLICLGLLLGTAMVLITCLKVNKIVKVRKMAHDALIAEANEILNACYEQTNSLNSLFEYNDVNKIIDKVTPVIHFNDYLSGDTFEMMHQDYHFYDTTDTSSSCIDNVSGTLNDFPFAFLKHKNQGWGSKTYTGSLFITWTEYVTDSEGNGHTVTRSQTLYANVVKPIPTYGNYTYLVYANDFVPDLTFTRRPTHFRKPSKKQVDRYVNREERDLERAANKAIEDGNLQFTPMNNTKFDTLFRAWNRDNGVGFLMMFDTLSQENMTDLITGDNPFGDDFTYEKNHTLTYIHSDHMQRQQLIVEPSGIYHYDVDTIHSNFVNKMCGYFESMYFTLAPLLCVTGHQAYSPKREIKDFIGNSNYSTYEHEFMVNQMISGYFSPDDGCMDNILKVAAFDKVGGTDKVRIIAHNFKGIEHVDFIPVLGGDGNMHPVPVPWVEYLPTQRESLVGIKRLNLTNNQFALVKDRLRGILGNSLDESAKYEKGLLAFFIDESYNESNDIALSEAIKITDIIDKK